MAICEDGTVVGSVSGGCIEDDLIARLLEAARQPSIDDLDREGRWFAHGGAPLALTYGVNADEAHRFGLPCGGTIELLLENNPDSASVTELLERLSAGRLVRRTVRLLDGQVTLEAVQSSDALRLDAECLSVTFGPQFRMLLIGAGQLAEYVATMALFNGFSVTVCDPRQEYRRTWSVPGVSLVTEMPDDVVVAMKADQRTCVIALTHDPKLDDLALLEALQTDAFYVGAIGSRRNSSARRERLALHFGVSDEALARLRGPIGLYIGSKTPSEIAVSVMAEVLAVRNGVDLPAEFRVERGKLSHEPSQEESAVCGLRLSDVLSE